MMMVVVVVMMIMMMMMMMMMLMMMMMMLMLMMLVPPGEGHARAGQLATDSGAAARGGDAGVREAMTRASDAFKWSFSVPSICQCCGHSKALQVSGGRCSAAEL
jgi:preprotein translocase subunit SecG